MRRLLLGGGVATLLAVALLVVGTVSGSPDRPSTQAPAPQTPIARAQAQLTRTPNDFRTWASLSLAYTTQAKLTVDPSYYAKAEGAAERSLAIDTKTNDLGYAALAAVRLAQHEFPAALAAAQSGLRINAFSATLYGALGDAYTQLGRYADATRAVDRMNQLQPGVAAFTRASYVFELRGQVPQARAALERALQDASSPPDIAFARTYLGELSLNYGGDAVSALKQFETGLVADPSDIALKAGRAKALAAVGRTREALTAYKQLVSSVPQPQYVLEYAELLESQGDPEAARQYALFGTLEDLFRANKVVLDTEPTLFEADHGSPAKALEYAAVGWRTRPFLEMADAYAWALYANRQYAAALTWSDKALATGWTNALFHFHRGMIQKALGEKGSARSELTRALALNPHFDVLQAPRARTALAEL